MERRMQTVKRCELLKLPVFLRGAAMQGVMKAGYSERKARKYL